MNLRHWLYGLLAALISGGAGAITTGVSLSIADPNNFNFGLQFGHTLKLMGITFCVNAVIGVAGYLKQSPLPPERVVWTDEQRQQAKLDSNTNAAGAGKT